MNRLELAIYHIAHISMRQLHEKYRVYSFINYKINNYKRFLVLKVYTVDDSKKKICARYAFDKSARRYKKEIYSFFDLEFLFSLIFNEELKLNNFECL